MANESLPGYLALAKPNPLENRGPWFKNTAPAYFGIFMWIAFYNDLGTSLTLGGLGAALVGLVAAALISHYLFHYVFGILGMRTGYPLYIVGSSTFGTKGGFLFPGIFMGLLQIGWYSVGTYFATDLVLRAFGQAPMSIMGPEGARGFSLLFVLVAIAWGYLFATLGAFGIQYVAKISTYLPWIALAMLVIAFAGAVPYIGDFKTPAANPNGLAAAFKVIALVIGFFATAGAAGADFGTNSRNAGDVNMAGLTGISLSILVAGGLAIATVAGAHGKYLQKLESVDVVVVEQAVAATTTPSGDAVAVEGTEVAAVAEKAPPFQLAGCFDIVSPRLAKLMFLFLAIGSMAPACFCASIIGNSLSTMIPSLPRVLLTLAGATVGIILAATGIAGNLVPFFGLIGASFGPICGAMVADYLLSGKKWAGPRSGISIAGYGSWLVGFLVGIANNPIVIEHLFTNQGKDPVLADWHPTGVYAFFVGFIVYAVLAKAGLQGKTVEYPGAAAGAK